MSLLNGSKPTAGAGVNDFVVRFANVNGTGSASANPARLDLQVRRDQRQHVGESTAGGVLTQRVHFPLRVVAIHLGHDLRGMAAIAGQLVTRDF